MTKAELIERISRNRDLPPDVTKKCIQEIVDIAFVELATYFIRTKVTRATSPRFTFPGFGTFTKKRRNARRGVNPRTLEPMEIEASATLDFKPASALKKAMNQVKDAAAARTGRKKRSSSKATTKTAPKATKKAEKKTSKRDSASRRRLRSREEVELESIDELPETPMRRAGRGSRRSVGRTG